MRTRVAVLGLLLTLVTAVPASWGLAAQYTLVPLDADVIPMGLDRVTGDLLVTRVINGQVHGLVGPPQGPYTDLGLLPDGTFLTPLGVHQGQVVGMANTGPFGLFTHAWRWERATGLVDLGAPGEEGLFSAATSTNGQSMVGYGGIASSGGIFPLQWVGSNPVIVLPMLGGSMAMALVINDAGARAGMARTPAGDLHAVLWPLGGGIVDLHTLPTGMSWATDLNAGGQGVGDVETPDGWRGFLTTGGAPSMTLLQPLAGDTWTSSRGLNDAGESVGHSGHYHSTLPLDGHEQTHQQATAWDSTGAVVDLLSRVTNGTDWHLRTALGITAGGAIVGAGTYQGVPTGFALIPLDTARGPKPAPPRNLRPRR